MVKLKNPRELPRREYGMEFETKIGSVSGEN